MGDTAGDRCSVEKHGGGDREVVVGKVADEDDR
jgi:hypothetical protein